MQVDKLSENKESAPQETIFSFSYLSILFIYSIYSIYGDLLKSWQALIEVWLI
jgi:hypothetical protein